MSFGPLQTFRYLTQHPLTMQHLVPAAVRYLRWQLGSRIAPGPVAVDFVNDARLLVRRGMTGATGNIYAGLHDFEDMAFLIHVLRAGDLFVDVGANIGTYTVLAAKVAGACVVAFEPIAAAAAALRDNVALNAIESLVTVRATGVGAAPGIAHMTTRDDTTNRVIADVSADGTTVAVPIERLDDALGDRAPFLLKIDVEGYETEVLRGAAGVLAQPSLQCVIMELSASDVLHKSGKRELAATLTSLGFERYAYSPRERRLEPSTSQRPTANSLFIRDRALVERRLAEAPPFRVLNHAI